MKKQHDGLTTILREILTNLAANPMVDRKSGTIRDGKAATAHRSPTILECAGEFGCLHCEILALESSAAKPI